MSSRQLITVAVSVDTSAMTAGDVIHTANIEFPVSGYGIGKVVQLTIIDPDHNSAANLAGDLWLFKSTVTQPAANAALDFTDANLLKLIGVIPVVAGDALLTASNTAVTTRLTAPLYFDLGASTSIFGVYRVTATPTFAGGTVTFILGVA